MTSNYVPGLRLEFARFYGEAGHFKLNFCVENSNFSQFFVSGIHIYTFSHNFAGKKIRFIGTLRSNFPWPYRSKYKKTFRMWSKVRTIIAQISKRKIYDKSEW